MSQRFYNFVQWLLFSRLVHGYEEHQAPQEDTYLGYFLFFFLEINDCFVLDHRDVSVNVRIPNPWGKLIFRYVVCLGEEQIRNPGFKREWWTNRKTFYPAETEIQHSEEFPF